MGRESGANCLLNMEHMTRADEPSRQRRDPAAARPIPDHVPVRSCRPDGIEPRAATAHALAGGLADGLCLEELVECELVVHLAA